MVTSFRSHGFAKEILAVNPYQRIILFVFCLYHRSSWQYGEAVDASCRLMQPFEPNVLLDTMTKRYTKAWRDYANIKQTKDLNPAHEKLREYLPKMQIFRRGRQTIHQIFDPLFCMNYVG